MSATLPFTFALWRRADGQGHDGCRILQTPNGGWQLAGTAVFQQAGQACALHYDVRADSGFATRRARVTGTINGRAVDLRVQASAARRWAVNGTHIPGLDGCLDLDLSFTPATNLLPLRRLALKVGQEADAPAAWLAFPRLRFTVLPQRYRRVSRTEYKYEAPTEGYRATLHVTPQGLVAHYPGLFELVHPAPRSRRG